MEFTYNDELLLDPKDLKTAWDNYPDIAFALDHEELRKSFETIDSIANNVNFDPALFVLSA